MNREPTPDGGVGDPLCTAAPDPAPPEPTDVASRLVAANAEAQRLQCECAVGFGAYACVENCEAELFKLEPNGDVECFRELLGTTLDTPTVECQLGAIEALNECVPSAECDDDAFTACLIPFEVALSSCPDAAQGFETLADGCFDRTGEELVGLYSASLDVAHEEACRCVADEERDACLAFKESPREDCLSSLLDIAPLPRRVTECLIEYLDEETEFLEDEACCESPDDFDCRSGTFWFSGPLNQLAGQRFRISGALVNCLGSEQNHIVYTATGTLSDAGGRRCGAARRRHAHRAHFGGPGCVFYPTVVRNVGASGVERGGVLHDHRAPGWCAQPELCGPDGARHGESLPRGPRHAAASERSA